MKTKIEQGCTRIHSGVAWLGLRRLLVYVRGRVGAYCRCAFLGWDSWSGVKLGIKRINIYVF